MTEGRLKPVTMTHWLVMVPPHRTAPAVVRTFKREVIDAKTGKAHMQTDISILCEAALPNALNCGGDATHCCDPPDRSKGSRASARLYRKGCKKSAGLRRRFPFQQERAYCAFWITAHARRAPALPVGWVL